MRQLISTLLQFSILIILSIVIISVPCYGQSTNQKIDSLISAFQRIGDFNGCVLVAQKGKIIFEKAYGFTDYTTSDTLTLDYQFRLASVSKQFTAMAVMILKERNELNYDRKVSNYLIDFPYKNITIRNLLNNTSGLPDYGELLEKYRDPINPEKSVVSNKDVYALLVKYSPPQKFKPGEEYQYSNTGYVILALLVEKISGQSFQEFLSDNIFTPLGMLGSYVNPPDGKLNDIRRAKGFISNPDGDGFIPNDWNYQNGMYGDGGIISTVDDLLIWDNALRNGILVSDSTLNEAFSQVRLNDGTFEEYGFGWSVIKQDTGKIVAHGGGWLGYTTGILRDLSKDQTVIQLCNMPSKRLIFQIWDILNFREVVIPEFVNVTFLVNSEAINENDSVFVTGNHKKLGNWSPVKFRLETVGVNRWQNTVKIEKGYKLEYKITRGSWDMEALYEKGIIPENSFVKIESDTLIVIDVPFWSDF